MGGLSQDLTAGGSHHHSLFRVGVTEWNRLNLQVGGRVKGRKEGGDIKGVICEFSGGCLFLIENGLRYKGSGYCIFLRYCLIAHIYVLFFGLLAGSCKLNQINPSEKYCSGNYSRDEQ
jgi:hypothetical protein